MTGSTTTEGLSYTLETKCGWKGVLKSATSTNALWNRDDDNLHGTTKNCIESPIDSSSHTTCSSSVSTVAFNTTRSSQEESAPFVPSKYFPSILDVSLYWMGGEPSKYDDNLEQRGVMSILKALTENERDEVIAFDMTVPIRHLRAEKVRS